MYCQPPLQSWGTFSLEKRGLIFLQRSTGRFSRGVSASLGRGGRAGRRAKCSGDREARSQGARGGFIGAARPPPCPRRGARTCVGARLSLVSRFPWPLTAGLCLSAAAATPLSLSCSVLALSCQSVSPFLSFIFKPRRGKKKKNLMKTLPSLPSFLILGPSATERETRRIVMPPFPPAPPLKPQSGVFFGVLFISGNCNTQSMLLR